MGFDIECIPNIQCLAGEYFCPVCRQLVYPNEALQSLCTHLYCKPCLTYVASTSRACPYDGYLVTEADAKPLVETNKALADTISKTTVHCLYQKSGCTWLGTLSESSSHCSGCAFGNSLVVCNRCGVQIVHRQVLEHAQVCPGTQQVRVQESLGSQAIATSGKAAGGIQTQAPTQAGAHVTTSQATPVLNTQGQAVATPTPEQWYQQQYQQYYQGYYGYIPYQQQALTPNLQPRLQSQSQPAQIAGQHQAVKSEPQTQNQVHLQPQLQAQGLIQPQSLVVPLAAPASQSQNQTVTAPPPQPYPSVSPLPQFPSQTYPASHDQVQSHSQAQPITQAYSSHPQVQHTQVPPSFQQFPGQTQSQLHMQHPMPPQPKPVQNIPPLHPAGQAQTLQQPAHFNGHLNYLQPHPNQRNQVGPQSSRPVLHQAGNQSTLRPPQMQNLSPQQMSSQPPHQSLFPMQKQQPPVHQKVGFSVHQSQVMQPTQQPISQQSLSQQPTMGQSSGVVHNQIPQQGPLPHPQVASQSHLCPQVALQGVQNNQQTTQLHQPSMQNHGSEPQMVQYSASALQGRSCQPVSSQPTVNQGEMQRTESQLPLAPKEQEGVTSRPRVGKQGDERVQDDGETTSNAASSVGNNVKCTEEEVTPQLDTEHKGNLTDGLVEYDQRSSKAVEHHEAKSELEGKQMMRENAANGLVNPGQSRVIEGKSTEADKAPQKIEKVDKNGDLPQLQVSLSISSRKNHPPVNHGLLNFQQSPGAPSGRVPAGVSHHMAVPRYPAPVLRPYGSENLPGTQSGFAAAQPFQGRLRPCGLGHLEHEGPYDIEIIPPSNASKVSPSAVNSFALGSGDGRFKLLSGDRLNPVPLEQGWESAGSRLFDEGFKCIPGPSPLEGDSFPRSGIFSRRPLDIGFTRIPPWPHEKYKVDFDSGPTSRVFPSFNDLGERQLGHRYISDPRIPLSEYPGMPSHGYGPSDSGPGGGRLSMDGAAGRDRFGFPSHFPRREFEVHGNIRTGEQSHGHDRMGPDVIPSHIRGDDQFGPHGLPVLSRLEEQVGLNVVSRRPGEPGFRSKYSLQGSFPFKRDVEPFENSRKRKLGTTGWCRICKVDCETMEGLDLHSQTKEHQKKSMDMVLMIKHNAKKYNPSSADWSRNNTKKADVEGHDSKKNGIA